MIKNESGRSMVEMLGVLAIIGVLSIGGIAGYTTAMNRFRANEIIDLASKVSVMGMTKTGTDKTADATDVGFPSATIDLHGITKIEADNNGVVQLTASGLTQGVADALNSIAGNKLGATIKSSTTSFIFEPTHMGSSNTTATFAAQ